METIEKDIAEVSESVLYSSEVVDVVNLTAVARGGTHPIKTEGGGKQTSQSTQSATTPQRGGHNRGRGATSGQTGKWCATCKKLTHNMAQCWSNKKKNVNPVDEEQQQQPEQHQEADPDLDNAVRSFFQSKK
jgi:hypothetical protein